MLQVHFHCQSCRARARIQRSSGCCRFAAVLNRRCVARRFFQRRRECQCNCKLEFLVLIRACSAYQLLQAQIARVLRVRDRAAADYVVRPGSRSAVAYAVAVRYRSFLHHVHDLVQARRVLRVLRQSAEDRVPRVVFLLCPGRLVVLIDLGRRGFLRAVQHDVGHLRRCIRRCPALVQAQRYTRCRVGTQRLPDLLNRDICRLLVVIDLCCADCAR